MIKISLSAMALGLLVSSASAMPLIQTSSVHVNALAAASNLLNVRIVCREDGYCYQRGRRPIAHWVYGEGNFVGPYTGPGNYGNPRYRWNWWPFW